MPHSTLPVLVPRPLRPRPSSRSQPNPTLITSIDATVRPLDSSQVVASRELHGPNELGIHKDKTWYKIAFQALVHPFNAILAVIAIVSGVLQDYYTLGVMLVMMLLGLIIRIVQEIRANNEAQSLKSLVSSTVTVLRVPEGDDEENNRKGVEVEVKLEDIVPGDVVVLSAGTMIPGDIQLFDSRDLFISEAALTGESIPVEKYIMNEKQIAVWREENGISPPQKTPSNSSSSGDKSVTIDLNKPEPPRVSEDLPQANRRSLEMRRSMEEARRGSIELKDPKSGNIGEKVAKKIASGEMNRPDHCLMGTSVVSGTAQGVVLRTGDKTVFGAMAAKLAKSRPINAFQKGIRRISYMFVGIMACMVPIVLILSGVIQRDWLQAFLFSISVAVGLTPDMLPMIVNTNLARGAAVLARQKTIVKRLDAISNFGSIDILCTDKTGTLTRNQVALMRGIDLNNADSMRVVEFAFLNSSFQTGLKNLLDAAVINYYEDKESAEKSAELMAKYTKIDEIPFDFIRRRMSVILHKTKKPKSRAIMVTKGAVVEMLDVCTKVELPDGSTKKLNKEFYSKALELNEMMNADGLRVVAVAYKKVKDPKKADEEDLILTGFVGFLDPPKDSTAEAISELRNLGIEVKVLTGDAPLVCKKVCEEVGLDVKAIVSSTDIQGLNLEELIKVAESGTIFARLSPLDKSNLVKALRSNGHVVGFMGDGINDALALHSADVGISVDEAVDVAKESSDIILLEKSLLVLAKAVHTGRQTYGNTIKYIKMAVSSNFGNVFSILVASAWLPFLPMLPVHIVIQNLLYDLSQIAIPWDKMDEDWLLVPRQWSALAVLKFMAFVGPISSLFDILTFVLMWFYFGIQKPLTAGGNPYIFQTAWFTVGLTTQTLIIHMIRTGKVPIIQSRPAFQMLLSSFAAVVLCLALPYIPIGVRNLEVTYPANSPGPINVINPVCPSFNATEPDPLSPSDLAPSALTPSDLLNITAPLVSNCTGTVTVNFLSMTGLPPIFYAFLAGIFCAYCILVQLVKMFYRAIFNGEWL